MVAAAWTGTLPGGAEIGKGLSLNRTSGGLLRSTRHALIANTRSANRQNGMICAPRLTNIYL
jgi:hypothetical protein